LSASLCLMTSCTCGVIPIPSYTVALIPVPCGTSFVGVILTSSAVGGIKGQVYTQAPS